MRNLWFVLLLVVCFGLVACCPGCGDCGGTCAPASEEPATEEVEEAPVQDDDQLEAGVPHMNGCPCCVIA